MQGIEESATMNSILLTGGTGFLGSALLRKLIADFDVAVLKRSTSRTDRVADLLHHDRIRWINLDEADLPGLFASQRFDVILHCATNYGRGKRSILDTASANLMLPLTLLQLGIEHGVKTFINTDTVIDKRVNEYSLSKKQFLEWLQNAAGRIQCVNVALEHFYGPFDDESKFTTMIFHKLMRGEPSIDLTPGDQKRHFIYIEDVVRAFRCILGNLDNLPSGFSSFEVSTEQSISIREFVLLAKSIAGNTSTQLNFGAIPYRANELMDSRTDISALKALGWHPEVSLEKGIQLTIEKENAK